jgi:hypothetical protein
MHYAHPQLALDEPLAPLDKFLHEVGMKEATPQERLSVTSSSLPAEGEPTRIEVMLPGPQ